MFIFFSCGEKKEVNHCVDIQKKYDSLLRISKINELKSINQFYKILEKEKNTLQDTLLINSYKSLIENDNLIDLYIWDRINTINKRTNKINVYNSFTGDYYLKPNHNKQYAQLTKISIKNDSCFLYKKNRLILKKEFSLINSSNKHIRGKVIMGNYKLSLFELIKQKPIIFVDDNNCMDCEQLQMIKK